MITISCDNPKCAKILHHFEGCHESDVKIFNRKHLGSIKGVYYFGSGINNPVYCSQECFSKINLH